jgi:hypothetical protein
MTSAYPKTGTAGDRSRSHQARTRQATPGPESAAAAGHSRRQLPAGLDAGLLYAEFGYALRASARPARTQARPAAPAGGPQAGQPRAIRQQLSDAAGARNGDDRPDPATGQRQPLPRSICRGIVRHATHDHYFPPFLKLVVSWSERVLPASSLRCETVGPLLTGTGPAGGTSLALSPPGCRDRTRCTVTMSDDGRTQVARHESSADGVSWIASMDVTLRKVA